MQRLLIFLFYLLCSPALAGSHGFAIPTADVVCTVTTGNCTGTGGGSSLFTPATCNGVADDAAAFISFNTWAVGTWQGAHSGLIELLIPAGSICEFISGNVTTNSFGSGIKRFQIVGYGATLGNGANGLGGGFFLGSGATAGIQQNGTTSTVRLATVAAGASSITLLDTSKCGLFNNGDTALIAGIDPQGAGFPPNPQVYEWIVVNSTVSCAGSGSITLTAPLAHSYKSTWPNYATSGVDQGGPATLYQLGSQAWVTDQAYFGFTLAQTGQTNAIGKNITIRDVNCPAVSSCIIPSQNLNFTMFTVVAPSSSMEVDKIVTNMTMNDVIYSSVVTQSGATPQNWSCTACSFNVNGTSNSAVFANSNLSGLNLGATSFGVAGSFSATNTAIAAMQPVGSNQSNIDTRGVWSAAGLTVPQALTVSAATNNGSGAIRLTVNTTAGWATGLTGDGTPTTPCAGTFKVTVIDATHLDLQGSTFTATCTGSFGSLPLNWAVPRANVFFRGGNHGDTVGPILQVADLAVGTNNSTVVSFNQNGSAYTGGLPTMPGGSPWSIVSHPAPSWSCTGCTGAINITDVTGVPLGPFGSQATRVVTAANSGSAVAMPVFGPLTEADVTVTAACSGASNMTFGGFTATLGSASYSTWAPTVNGQVASGTPRVITPTTSSGAQSGDVLTTPGAGTLVLNAQEIPAYSSVGNCGTASTTVTFKTNQGVVYP